MSSKAPCGYRWIISAATRGGCASGALEPAEVQVVGVDLRLVLHCHRGYVGVGHQVPANTGGNQVSAEMGEMFGSGVNRNHLRETKPFLDEANGFIRGSRVRQYAGVSRQPNESRGNNPRDPDTFLDVDQSFPPTLIGVVIGSSIVVGVDQQIEVRDYQLEPGPSKASTSRWSLI